MKTTLIILRILFIALCGAGGWLLCLAVPEWTGDELRVILISLLFGGLIVLTDLLLKGFSIRGLTSLTFGLAVGAIVSFLISKSPLFEYGDAQIVFIARLALFIVCSYLGAVIALRSRDDFNFVIPFVKLVPHNVESPLIVVDASALVDGRIARVCETNFLTSAVVVPRLVLGELQRLAESGDTVRQARGKRGLEVLNQLQKMDNIELRLDDSTTAPDISVEDQILFLCRSLKAKLLTCEPNLGKLAQIHGIRWLNLQVLAKAMIKEWMPGESLSIDLVKAGREEGQAVGYLEDGSMVVASDGRAFIGQRVEGIVTGVVPSAGGKIVFMRVTDGSSVRE